MMPTYLPYQGLGQLPPAPLPGPGPSQCPIPGHAYQYPAINVVTPSKRLVDEDDDDVQFISEKPVKRRKISERQQPATPMSQPQPQPQPQAATLMLQQPTIPLVEPSVANLSVAPMPMQMPTSDLHDAERRLSTGMVGLPSDLHAVELSYALRGVSMPVLEKFVLDQPLRKPRPSSPPELSPKQLPSTISPGMLDVQNNPSRSEASSCQAQANTPEVFPNPSQKPCHAEKPAATGDLVKDIAGTNQVPPPDVPTHPKSPTTSTSSTHHNGTGWKNTYTPPRPLPPPPYPEASQITPSSRSSPTPSEEHNHHNAQAHLQKQPCQACFRLRQQAQLSRAQGLSMVNAPLPPQFMPQLHYHQAYSQPLHPQMMGMPTGNLHQFGPGFAPMMMPVNGIPFTAIPPRLQPKPQQVQQVNTLQKEANDGDHEKQLPLDQSRKAKSPQISTPKETATSPSVTPSPIRPPASLIQPTYRKPSPNLIVDVAETCQQKFPFEDVAKRHNVPIDKVFDVFAAIIQVPLLRCPTDRRRPGKLATGRIKEYNKAKMDIQESRTTEGKGGSDGKTATVSSTDIAQRLGQVDFPEGFTLGGQSS